MNHSVSAMQASSKVTDAPASGTTRQYLSFELAGQEYGIDIQRVQEIRAAEPATRIPNTPDHVLGVINLRGHVVPIVDLRRRFGLPEQADAVVPVIVIVRVPLEGRSVTAGLQVDAVSEVCSIDSGALRPAPQVGTGAESRFVDSLAVSARGLMILLDVQRLVDGSLFAAADQRVA
jgi:purine-binding chemotaxis protein CheW